MKRPSIALRSLPLLVLAASWPAAGDAPAASRPVAIFLVRHAEKAGGDPRDPALADAGRERATALAHALSAAGVTHLYSSEFARTRQTLEPLAALSGVEIEAIPAGESRAQLQALRGLGAGAVAVVAGHSNTVPALVCDLGGRADDLDCSESGRKLDEADYDKLFLVLLPPPTAAERTPLRTLSLRYGR